MVAIGAASTAETVFGGGEYQENEHAHALGTSWGDSRDAINNEHSGESSKNVIPVHSGSLLSRRYVMMAFQTALHRILLLVLFDPAVQVHAYRQDSCVVATQHTTLSPNIGYDLVT